MSSGGGGGSTTVSDPYAGQLGNLADLQAGYGNQFLGTGMQQYQQGYLGQLTPAQQAAYQQTLGNMNLGTQGTYANLGLGGSTMQQQDLNANALRGLAEQANLNALNERLGLAAAQEGGTLLGGAGSSLGMAGNQTISAQDASNRQSNAKTGNILSALGGFGNTSAGGGGSGGSGGLLSGLLGGSGTGTGTPGMSDVWTTGAGTGTPGLSSSALDAVGGSGGGSLFSGIGADALTAALGY